MKPELLLLLLLLWILLPTQLLLQLQQLLPRMLMLYTLYSVSIDTTPEGIRTPWTHQLCVRV